MTWEYFQYRWDRMQSADIGANKMEIKRIHEDVMTLERVLVYLVTKIVLGQKLSIDDPIPCGKAASGSGYRPYPCRRDCRETTG